MIGRAGQASRRGMRGDRRHQLPGDAGGGAPIPSRPGGSIETLRSSGPGPHKVQPKSAWWPLDHSQVRLGRGYRAALRRISSVCTAPADACVSVMGGRFGRGRQHGSSCFLVALQVGVFGRILPLSRVAPLPSRCVGENGAAAHSDPFQNAATLGPPSTGGQDEAAIREITAVFDHARRLRCQRRRPGTRDARSRRQGRRAERPDHARQPEPVAKQPDPEQQGRLQASSGRRSPRSIPTGRSTSSSSARISAASMPACSEQARAGRAPDCVTVNSFQLALFVKNGVLQPLDEFFTKEEIDDLFPFIREGITGTDGHIYAWWWDTDLRVLYRNKDLVPTPPQTWDELQGSGARGGRKRRRRRPLQRRPLGGHHLRLAGATSGPGRRARRRQRQADLRRGREPREDAEGAELLQGPRRQRRRAEARRDDQDLRRLQRRGASPAPPRCSSAATGSTSSSRKRCRRISSPSGKSPSCPGRRPTSASTGTGGWTVAAFSKDPDEDQAVHAISCARSTWARRTR